MGARDLMAKLVRLDEVFWPLGGYGQWRPACRSGHEINVDRPNRSGAQWTFDGDAAYPTFHPSVNLRWGSYADPNFKPSSPDHDPSGVCHYTITRGKITYAGDCTHSLRGQAVDLPDIPDDKYPTSERL